MRWLPPILWTAVVLAASSDLFSAQHTGSLFALAFARLFGHAPAGTWFDIVHVVIRKAAHLTEYGILGVLWLRALRRDASLKWAVMAVAIAAAVATLDELHQSFIPSRGASPYDVLLDIAGAALTVAAMRARMLLSVTT